MINDHILFEAELIRDDHFRRDYLYFGASNWEIGRSVYVAWVINGDKRWKTDYATYHDFEEDADTNPLFGGVPDGLVRVHSACDKALMKPLVRRLSHRQKDFNSFKAPALLQMLYDYHNGPKGNCINQGEFVPQLVNDRLKLNSQIKTAWAFDDRAVIMSRANHFLMEATLKDFGNLVATNLWTHLMPDLDIRNSLKDYLNNGETFKSTVLINQYDGKWGAWS